MANEKNLEKGKETRFKSGEKAAEAGRKGGIASGQVRGFKSALKDYVINGQLNDKTKKAVAKYLNKEESEVNLNDVAIANLIMSMNGKNSTRAIELFFKYTDDEASAPTGIDQEKLEIERQRLKIEQEKHEIELLKARKELELDKEEEEPYMGLPALQLAPPYLAAYHDLYDRVHSEYTFYGGRGSIKSSTISLFIVDIIKRYPLINAMVMRKVADTMADSVYAQIEWAIDVLGFHDEFKFTKSPLQITYKKTGQKIYFRGADKPGKLKSLKPKKGYVGILWFEELDQFNGENEIRNITQSAIRGEGSDVSFVFKSFNPPQTAMNWANKFVLVPKPDMYTLKVNYTDVPAKWLGEKFINDADFLKEINPKAYRHEYLGEATGNGGNVFENVILREITNEEVRRFDRVLRGVDWGWYPDPYNYGACHYDAARLTLYIFEEYRCVTTSNAETARVLKEEFKIGSNIVTCDSEDNKSIGDYRAYNIAARGAVKGPGSVEYSMKWLASLKAIIIDPKRCPHAAEEFSEYEYLKDKDGNPISGYPDKNNHAIDCIRYATETVWKKKGQ